jgi:hypothetical protein
MVRVIGRCLTGAACVAVVVLQLNSTAIAGPWLQHDGHGFLINTLSFLEANSEPGNLAPAYGDGDYSRLNIASYLEYGLTKKVTVGTSLRLERVRLHTASDIQRSTGVSDVELFVRRVLWRKGQSILSAQGTVVFPTGYNPDANPALGDGDASLEPRLLFGRGFAIGAWPSFFDAQGAFRFRFGDAADQVRLDGTLGTHPAEGWLLLLQSCNTLGLRNERGYGTDYDLYTISVSAVRDLSPRWSVQLGATREIAGRNYSTGTGVFAALWWKF